MPLAKIEKIENSSNNLPFDLNENETVHFTQVNVLMFLNLEKPEGKGTLYVTTKRALWFPSDASEKEGFEVDFHHILAHAIARTGTFSDFAQENLYCQLESPNGEEELSEVRFVIEEQNSNQNSNQIEALYKAFCECAALNPDEIDEDEGDFYFNKEEVEEGAKNKRRKVEENVPGEFEDASEDEDDEKPNGNGNGKEEMQE